MMTPDTATTLRTACAGLAEALIGSLLAPRRSRWNLDDFRESLADCDAFAARVPDPTCSDPDCGCTVLVCMLCDYPYDSHGEDCPWGRIVGAGR